MYEYRCSLNRVIDGDTLDLDVDLGFNIITKVRVRLLEVDTFELRDPDKSLRRKAEMEKLYAENILKDQKKLILRSQKTGKYGRWLGEIILESSNQSFNQIMAIYHETIKNYVT
jgi:micrococcal nuclease